MTVFFRRYDDPTEQLRAARAVYADIFHLERYCNTYASVSAAAMSDVLDRVMARRLSEIEHVLLCYRYCPDTAGPFAPNSYLVVHPSDKTPPLSRRLLEQRFASLP
jgi:hypothetical protein